MGAVEVLQHREEKLYGDLIVAFQYKHYRK